jgi:hypothetical protein
LFPYSTTRQKSSGAIGSTFMSRTRERLASQIGLERGRHLLNLFNGFGDAYWLEMKIPQAHLAG